MEHALIYWEMSGAAIHIHCAHYVGKFETLVPESGKQNTSDRLY
ncbi:Hypothetical protein c2462 [Escherichia coli CFT073]|uniref:Uncharacterized protein n=1 Tax=Escherichia coli O6:H1 (strain CFT073 / ATCC 700928 / UPEC) TaxID=199310 RepID=A0A0H2V8E3_ECOL6|nr:Hypothetical protein c2462 [Escherichia coli CFT073]